MKVLECFWLYRRKVQSNLGRKGRNHKGRSGKTAATWMSRVNGGVLTNGQKEETFLKTLFNRSMKPQYHEAATTWKNNASSPETYHFSHKSRNPDE